MRVIWANGRRERRELWYLGLVPEAGEGCSYNFDAGVPTHLGVLPLSTIPLKSQFRNGSSRK